MCGFFSSTTLLVFVITCVVARLVLTKTTKSSGKLPPGPWAWPVVGNLPAILYGGQPHRALAGLAAKFGPLMTVSVGPSSKVVVLSSAPVVKKVLVENASFTSDRRIPPLLELAFSTKGSVIFENGTTWKTHRRIVLSGFRKGLSSSSAFNTTLKSSLLHLRYQLMLRENQQCQPSAEISAAIAEIVSSLCFGHCLDVRTNADIAEALAAVESMSRGLSGVSLAHIFPRLFYTPLYSKLRRDIDKFKSILKTIVGNHQNQVRDGVPIHEDIVDLYLKETSRRDENGAKSEFDADDIWRAMFDLLGAGTGTTSETLMWGILFMCLNPSVQKRVQKELDSHTVSDDPNDVILLDRRASLPFTHAAVLELLRCSCVAPLSLPRVTSRDVTLMDYTIPSGTELWVNEWAINRDPNVWTDPDEFKPDRFLDDAGKVDRGSRDAIVVFGEGRRKCLGRNLAETMLFSYFSNIFRWFEFRFPDDGRALPNVNEGNFGLTYSPPPYEVIITPRNLNSQSSKSS
ncbi:cytochrome P450 2U1-like [Diadema setosum]|uniref:cytochrome P450 2U1-like n=1 Tax=Diadema setosum TaxID=31175 RepID=UPI003B3B8583